jgi:hypothetical protein
LLIQSATEDAERDKAWQEVELAASRQPAEALFHCLDKSLLLKHLRELKPDETVNGKGFYKSYVKWEDLNQTQRNKTIIFWVTNLTDGVRFALKQCVEADAANESAEEANSGNCMTSSNGGEDAVRDDDSKRKHRSEARKRQRAAKKLKETLGLGVEAGDEVVYCRLMLEPLDGSRQTNIGFIRVNSGRVTFLGARAQIMREIESIFLPQTWRFFIPTLGCISPTQEAEIIIDDVFDESTNYSQLELGCVQNPVTIVIQDCTVLHDIYNN